MYESNHQSDFFESVIAGWTYRCDKSVRCVMRHCGLDPQSLFYKQNR